MKRWRSKQIVIQISRKRRLIVTLRRFHTTSAQRSKKYRQLVIPIDNFTIKELAIRQTSLKGIKAHATRRQRNFWRFSVSLPTFLIISGLSSAGYFGTQLVAAHSLKPAHTFAAQVPAPTILANKALPYSEPTHITIASVNISADIIPVGLDADGTLQLPPLLSNLAGWYHYSPSPGQVGPTIIVGHVDNYKTISVFWRLRYVKRGDIVQITRADGTTVKFKITGLAQYDQNNFPTHTVYGNITYPGIRIITCGGSFDEQTHSYTQNTVVSGFITN